MIGLLKEVLFPKKILGLNARNLEYIFKLNPRKSIKIVKNKLLTKYILKKHGFPIPKTYFKISNTKELYNFDFNKLPDSFVLKPNLGYGGNGIIIVYSKTKNKKYWISSGGKKLKEDVLKLHIFKILEGAYTENKKDIAFFEERVKLEKTFKPFTFKGGIPDIRIIVYKGFPVMGMLRIPTEFSEGRANLALGAIGCGIDFKTGTLTHGILWSKPIDYFYKTRILIKGIKIPYFREILLLSVKTAEVFKLGYCGVDIAIDRERGPLVLELNAWPGLKIQLANMDFLKEKLLILKDIKKVKPESAINIAREIFAKGTPEEQDVFSNKKIINVFEEIEILGPKKTIKTIAKIDTGAWRTSLDEDLAKELGLEVIENKFVKTLSSLGEQKRQLCKLVFRLAGEKIKTEASVAKRGELRHKIIIGRRDLKNFLINPEKKI